MIEITNVLNKGEWWIKPVNRNTFGEAPSNHPLYKNSTDLEKDLSPLLYGRYCMLCIAKSGERYDGLGFVMKGSDGKPFRMLICEE